jgi:aspartate aminotransferase/aminotransferase
MSQRWIADRMGTFDSSGIRKAFDLAAKLKNPINLSIGQPHFDTPAPVKEAAIAAIRAGRNAYSQTQGVAPLREALQARVDAQYRHADRKLFVASGTSGGLVLALWAVVNPGDEVIIFDPFFLMYPPLVSMCGGRPVLVDTLPDFRIDPDRVAAAITPRTKAIIFNSPANPTGVTARRDEVRALAELALRRGVLLISDEVYSAYCYDEPFVSPALFNEQTLVIDGFSKSHSATGWRLGYAHGPAVVIEQMIKTQQYTFVCAPHPLQWAALAALEVDMGPYQEQYRRKRDHLYEALREHYELVKPTGAFYAFMRVPASTTGSAFAARAIEHNLIIVPGNIFSRHDTHVRISYAAEDATIDRGIEVLTAMRRELG